MVTICSQFGEPVHINLVRDKETGKSRGFAFLKYEDQRSTDLAVDNLGGATVLGRILRVDHVRYKRRDDEEDEGDNVARLMGDSTVTATTGSVKRKGRRGSEGEDEEAPRRPQLKEEKELVELIQTHDEEDPMKEFLIAEKKEEIAQALERIGGSEKKSSQRRNDSRERSSRHHRHHRHRRNEGSRERRHRDHRSPSRERRSHRDRSPSRRERSHRDRSPRRSRSPESRRHRDRHDRQL